MSETAQTTVDQSEVDRFSAMAAEWWSPTGKFRPLHKFNPVRLEYIRNRICDNFGRDPKAHRPLEPSCMDIIHRTGVFYNVLQDRWNLSPDMEVNYMMLAKRPAQG